MLFIVSTTLSTCVNICRIKRRTQLMYKVANLLGVFKNVTLLIFFSKIRKSVSIIQNRIVIDARL